MCIMGENNEEWKHHFGTYSESMMDEPHLNKILNIFCKDTISYSDKVINEMIRGLYDIKKRTIREASCEYEKDYQDYQDDQDDQDSEYSNIRSYSTKSRLCRIGIDNSIEWEDMEPKDFNFDSSIKWLNQNNVRTELSNIFSELGINDAKYCLKEFMGVVFFELRIVSRSFFHKNTYSIELYPNASSNRIRTIKIDDKN